MPQTPNCTCTKPRTRKKKTGLGHLLKFRSREHLGNCGHRGILELKGSMTNKNTRGETSRRGRGEALKVLATFQGCLILLDNGVTDLVKQKQVFCKILQSYGRINAMAKLKLTTKQPLLQSNHFEKLLLPSASATCAPRTRDEQKKLIHTERMKNALTTTTNVAYCDR